MTATEEFQTEHFLHRSLSRHPLRWVTGFFLLALAWRGINCCFGETSYDGFGFIMIARSILEDGHLATPYICKDILYHHDWLYPLFIAGAKVLTGNYFWGARLVNVLAGALLVYPLFGFTRDVYGTRPGVYAAALVVINPLLAEYSNNALSEPLYLLFGLTGMWWWWRAWDRQSWRYLLGGSLMMALATFARSQGVAVVFAALLGLMVVAIFFRKTSLARGLMLIGAMAVTFAALYFPLNRALHPGQSGVSTKISQEMFKKNYIFDEKNVDWLRWERNLTADGNDLVWIKLSRDNGPFWMLKSQPGLYWKIVARDFGYFLVNLADNRILPFILMFPFLAQVFSDTRKLNFRGGAGIYLTFIIAGTVASLALLAVTLYRYLVITVPLFLIFAGGGMDTIDRFVNYILRPDRVPKKFFEYFPALIILAAFACYAHPKLHNFSHSEPVDDLDRQVAGWVKRYTDPNRRENIMTFSPSVPAYTGDFFQLLPFDKPSRVAKYAHEQKTDFVLVEERYLNWCKEDVREAYISKDLTSVGLERLGDLHLLDYKKMPSSYLLFKVVPPRKTDSGELLEQVVTKLASRGRPPADQRPNVIMISLDTTRADHLSCYGYERSTTPNLDLLAYHGVRFSNAISQAPKTAPSHMTMFTSLYPFQHGVHLDYWKNPPKVFGLSDKIVTMPELFKRAGYRTAAWTGGGDVCEKAGFAGGFDSFKTDYGDINYSKMESVRKWIEEDPGKPFFIFLHTYQVHDPYTPPREYQEVFDDSYKGWIISDRDKLKFFADSSDWNSLHNAFWRQKGHNVEEDPDTSFFKPRDVQHLIALYDSNILYADKTLAELFSSVLNNPDFADTILVITADHGEEFLEHGHFLHKRLYRETLHVPLIIYAPGRLPSGTVIDSQVPLLDLAPTILDLAGIPRPDQFMGKSLLPLVRGVEQGDRLAYSENPWTFETPHRALRDGRFFLYVRVGEPAQLFDMMLDPTEQKDMSGESKEARQRLQAEMDNIIDEASAHTPQVENPETDVNKKELKKLKDLGYVQ